MSCCLILNASYTEFCNSALGSDTSDVSEIYLKNIPYVVSVLHLRKLFHDILGAPKWNYLTGEWFFKSSTPYIIAYSQCFLISLSWYKIWGIFFQRYGSKSEKFRRYSSSVKALYRFLEVIETWNWSTFLSTS